jgi:predicted ribosome quality control (RQC) complex YloA/Tae2 family protein
MFDISNLEYLVENDAANKKIEKLRAEQVKTAALIAKYEREIEQGENKIKRLMSCQSKQERKARTRRLIERGAITKAFIDNAETLTNDELKAILQRQFTSDIVAFGNAESPQTRATTGLA